MKILPILWQRLVNAQGETCPRCAGTGDEVSKAVAQLKEILEPLGVEPCLETRAIDEAAFQKSPLESNAILIAGRPIEFWIGGKLGSSQCCDACGDIDCRTLEVDGNTYEVVPHKLLVRAGVIAGTRLLDTSLSVG